VAALSGLPASRILPEAYRLTTPASPQVTSYTGWVLGNLEDTCTQGFGVPTVLAGFDATWKP